MSLEELYENMAIEEMLMCPDFPVELIVRKMQEAEAPQEKLMPDSFDQIKEFENDPVWHARKLVGKDIEIGKKVLGIKS